MTNSIQWSFAAVGLVFLLASCNSPTATNSQASVNKSATVDYSKRIGVAVRTPSRTCLTTADTTLQNGSPVTLVIPTSPQSFVGAQIVNQSADPCPITQEVSPGLVSYEVSVLAAAGIPKLSPLFAVMGAPESAGFAMDNLDVQADLDQTHNKNTFRACGSADGVHLTAWRGVPITGTRLWAGHYYESGAPGSLPACTVGELAAN